MRKTILCFALAVIMIAACGCGNKNGNIGDDTSDTSAAVSDSADETVIPDTSADETGTPEGHEPTVIDFVIPESSREMSTDFALRLLELCTGHFAAATAELFTNAGFEVRTQKYYDKNETDVSHTAAYTVGLGFAELSGVVRPVVLIAVRGTVAGEWYSNFDIIPSRNPSAVYSENFLSAAEEVFLGAQKTLSEYENPIIVVCGHSRGAACANLLGVMLDRVYPVSDVSVYTFATPATLRQDGADEEYPNVFNFINPEDFVTYLPLSAWGFSRAGKDVILEGDEGLVSSLASTVASLASVSPDVASYYGQRHSLTSSGLSDTGLTTFELMSTLLAGSLAGGSGASGASAAAFISPESDLFGVTSAFASIAASGFSGHMPQVYAEKIGLISTAQ
ncbi:MAG: hypothetical protein J5830_05565 [Clostridia bacterium]|nr:hypothetical protein [Clostridia bacterium]